MRGPSAYRRHPCPAGRIGASSVQRGAACASNDKTARSKRSNPRLQRKGAIFRSHGATDLRSQQYSQCAAGSPCRPLLRRPLNFGCRDGDPTLCRSLSLGRALSSPSYLIRVMAPRSTALCCAAGCRAQGPYSNNFASQIARKIHGVPQRWTSNS